MVISSISSSYRTSNISYVTRGPLLVGVYNRAPWALRRRGMGCAHGLGFRVKGLGFRV